ncbi:Crp/Fnr family transcriptional regulator [Arundinibacter roseus]|uniref:Cyclic nucleotide-binding domain-containing protein n=1 Tax=Arundinibacter roseus TaxID=2070510 RepID=A0A4R4K5E8_9BACT|nr:cyclic nucleotide-binding domain-containing protein [Arundinibacter roseus]TDB62694.1 cyclic nucleotide-binding domain-containing protein [Arundinibacter roseus]
MLELSDFIKSKINISDNDLQAIVSSFQVRTVQKGNFLIKKGQFVTSFYFIKSGGLRIYFDRDEKQITGWLAFKSDFFTELNSLKSGQPTLFNIQAIEDTTLLSIDKIQMENLYTKFPAWQQFGREIWEDAFLKVINGILSYQTMTAEERYLNMLKHSDLLQRVPLKQLASYLGITQTSLSRLRKSI